MNQSGRFLVQRTPKQRSFLKSFVFFFSLLSGSFLAAAYLRGNFNEQLERLFKRKDQLEPLIRMNKLKNSVTELNVNALPQLLVLGIYESGDSLFFHQFKEVAEKFMNHQDLKMCLANINVKDEKSILDQLEKLGVLPELNTESIPIVLFLYRGKELKKWKLKLQYTNRMSDDLYRRVEGLINYKLQVLQP